MKEKKLGLRDGQATIKISRVTLEKVKRLCDETGYKQITVLEYLLNGKISLNKLNK